MHAIFSTAPPPHAADSHTTFTNKMTPLLLLCLLPLAAARSHSVWADTQHFTPAQVAGVVVGCVGVVALVIGAIFLCIWLRRRDRLRLHRDTRRRSVETMQFIRNAGTNIVAVPLAAGAAAPGRSGSGSSGSASEVSSAPGSSAASSSNLHTTPMVANNGQDAYNGIGRGMPRGPYTPAPAANVSVLSVAVLMEAPPAAACVDKVVVFGRRRAHAVQLRSCKMRLETVQSCLEAIWLLPWRNHVLYLAGMLTKYDSKCKDIEMVLERLVSVLA